MKLLLLTMVILASAPLIKCNFAPKFPNGIIKNESPVMVMEA